MVLSTTPDSPHTIDPFFTLRMVGLIILRPSIRFTADLNMWRCFFVEPLFSL